MMGKGVITINCGDCLYEIRVVKKTTRAEANISAFEQRIIRLNAQIASQEEELEKATQEFNNAKAAVDALITANAPRNEIVEAVKAVNEAWNFMTQIERGIATLKLQRLSCQKMITYLEKALVPEYRYAWCTDYTDDLPEGATVGTMEMDGLNDLIIITPGGDVNKSFGLLEPAIANTKCGAAFNWAIEPWWQKYRPSYRVAVIINVPSAVPNADEDTCDVGILPAYSRHGGINVNQAGDGEWFYAETGEIPGYVAFCKRNPDHPICVPTSDVYMTLTQERWQKMLEVQREVNLKMRYRSDTTDFWSIPDEGSEYVGDCEDMALLKMKKLKEAGFPDGCLKLALCSTDPLLYVDHAILVVLTNMGNYALDINFEGVIRVENGHYHNLFWQHDGAWGRWCVRLNNVPITYMPPINADAFAPGDRVVIQFGD